MDFQQVTVLVHRFLNHLEQVLGIQLVNHLGQVTMYLQERTQAMERIHPCLTEQVCQKVSVMV